jgi:hypothetical protein
LSPQQKTTFDCHCEEERRGNHGQQVLIVRPSKILSVLTISLLTLFALTACGSGDSNDSVSTTNDGDDAAPVLRIDETFTIENFEAAGFKLSKEFDTDTVPLATNVYYGFADRRDIEIRKYATHADAMSAGVESALTVLGRSPNSNSGGGIITSTGNRTSYHAYLVAGNVVMLCQTDISVCVDLVEATQSGG